MKEVLLIDDEFEMLESLQKILARRKNLNLTLMSDPSSALKEVAEKKFDLIITDLKMGEISGLDILKTAIKSFPESKIIIISGYGTIEASVEALHFGAVDFLEKPFSSKKLFESIDNVFEYTATLDQSQSGVEGEELFGLVYNSREMRSLVDIIKKVAQGNMNILISGESGTGKEIAARIIHKLSKGNQNPFVPINCGALPENLFESELFGHEKGAFTGAFKTKPGLLEFANNGTFFFDEIGEMSQTIQVKILRMLEERKIRHVGGEKEIDINVRVISATNKNLENEVANGAFRQDLFYRLNTIEINIPPLRNRKEDILPLASKFLSELSDKNDKEVNGFSHEAREALLSYSWPGNVRELQNIVGRAYFLSNSKIIDENDLPLTGITKANRISKDVISLNYKEAKEKTLESFEIEYLTYHLRKNKGNISLTAEKVGLDRRSIHRLISKYNIIYKN